MACLDQIFESLKDSFANTLNQSATSMDCATKFIHYLNPLIVIFAHAYY